jgi:spermidine synthase
MMGGTLPLISRFLIRNENEIGVDTGIIYSLNTFGAVAGCIITGFYLIENIGVTNSLYLAAALNCIAGGGAYVIDRSQGVKESRGQEKKELKPLNPLTLESSNPRIILLAFGFSGMAALSYEVLWTRVLILILDNTIYAFSIILFTFLLGIAGGSFIFSRIQKSSIVNRHSVTLFAIFQILIGLMGFLSLLLFANYNYLSSGLNTFISWIVQSVGMGYWWGKILAAFLMTFLIMIIPTMLMGASFPAISTIYLKDLKDVGKGIGGIYLVNTVGSIIGSFSAGFILLPLIGIQKSIIFTGIIPLISGIALIFLPPLHPPLTKGGRREGKLIRYIVPASSLAVGFIIIVFIYRVGDIPR